MSKARAALRAYLVSLICLAKGHDWVEGMVASKEARQELLNAGRDPTLAVDRVCFRCKHEQLLGQDAEEWAAGRRALRESLAG